MKNLKQLVLPCYKLEMANVRGGMVLPAREHGTGYATLPIFFPFCRR